MSTLPQADAAPFVAATRGWVERVVIGLNLCPFAKAVQVKEQVRYVVSDATTGEALLGDLLAELKLLAEADPERIDTTLLIHPHALGDFLDYNDFLDIADAALEELDLDGVLQVASFHPQYQFADTEADDVANCSNRSPWPTLHLLREASVDRAVAAFPEAESIYERNIVTLHALGYAAWARLTAAEDPGGGDAGAAPPADV